MKKNSARGISLIVLVLVVFSVMAFVIPFAHTATFWVGYGFGVLAILYQLYIFKLSFSAGSDAKSRFYGFPIARIGVYYLITQLIVSVIEMALAKLLPVWVSVVVNLLILVVAMIGCITVDTMRDEIIRQDKALKKNVSAMRELQSLSASLVNQCSDASMNGILSRIADEFRFSDPISSENTRDLEADMRSQMDDIQQALIEGDSNGVRNLCTKLIGSLRERNRICSLSK